MTSQGFSFPPPPPPPPAAQPAYPQGQHGHGQQQHVQNWGRGGHRGRGRGQGHGNRGRGGHYQEGGRPSYPNTGYSYPSNYAYPAPSVPTSAYMPPPPYPGQSQGFQNHQNQPAYPPQFPQTPGSYQQLPYNTPNMPQPYPPTPTYMTGLPTPPHGTSANPAIMGWGAEVPGHAAYMPAQPHARGPRPPHAHNGHNGHNGHSGPKLKQNHKRDHSSAFSKHTAPRTPAAPAVPSFGNPLPSKPPPAADANGNNRKQKKRKRKHNQLGLTPKTEDHESSEDDEEADEESKLATGESDAAPLQFSYRGQTATLQTPSEIAAWIAERKKKFPTKARVEEKQKVADEAKATREAARQLKCNEQQAKRNADRKPSDSNTESPNRADNQRRADKIQRNLDREQKRIAKAIAEAEAARLRFEALQKEALSLSSAAQEGSDIKTEPHDLPPISNEPPNEPRISESPLEAHPTVDADVSDPIIEIENPLDGDGDGADDMDISGSDWTSSSGSEADSNSESDSDSAPEQVSSRRTGPEKVAPPPREGKKTTCRYFARTGQCNRGDQCKFLHETTERGPKPKAEKKDKGRKGLYQALLDRQKQDEDHRAMEVISWLGQNNMLAPPDTQPH